MSTGVPIEPDGGRHAPALIVACRRLRCCRITVTQKGRMKFSSVRKFVFPLLAFVPAWFAPAAEGLDKSIADEQSSSQLDQSLYSSLKWRLVGPFRGGRTLAVTGVSDEPNLFYFGAVAGGIWKTVDGGETWQHLEGNGLPDGILGRIGVSVFRGRSELGICVDRS